MFPFYLIKTIFDLIFVDGLLRLCVWIYDKSVSFPLIFRNGLESLDYTPTSHSFTRQLNIGILYILIGPVL